MRAVEHEVRGEIMRTDVFVKIASEVRSESDLSRDLADAFAMFRETERRFSRFRDDSELSRLNGVSEFRVSPEMASLLSEALSLHRETDGIFDPSILPALESEGYAGSFGDDSFGIPSGKKGIENGRFDSVVLEKEAGIVRKPKDLRIDLGGIAKGYAVDRVTRMLRERGNADFLVDAGGDIFASGRDVEHGYGYWAIDIAAPTDRMKSGALLMLRDMSVATSGTDRRRWAVGEEEKHHLIDPRSGKSAATDLLSVTVVGESTIRAEVLAKTLCILGRGQALAFAERLQIPVFLVTTDGETVYNSLMRSYVYDESKR